MKTKPPLSAKQQLEALRQKIVDRIQQKPEVVGKVLSDWVQKPPKKASLKNTVRKKAG